MTTRIAKPSGPSRHTRAQRAYVSRSESALGAVFCIPDDQVVHLPHDERLLERRLPLGAALPRVGEIVYLTSSSAWVVACVVHEMLASERVRVELWLEHVGVSRHPREASCGPTH